MTLQDARVTARIVRTEDDETFHKYEVCGISYLSAEDLGASFEAR